jgi:ABC-type transport system substrate-binding protein
LQIVMENTTLASHAGRLSRSRRSVSPLRPAPPLPRPGGSADLGIHVSLAPTWFDPAETPGIITPFMVLYALHDGMVKPMPGQPLAPSLAESWSGSEDGLAYDFLVRKDAKFHRGMALWRRSEKEQSRKQGGELSPSIPPTVRFSPLAL